MKQVYLARHNKVWQNIKTGEVLTDKLTLKEGEKLTAYRQIPKPKEQTKVMPKEQSEIKNPDFFRTDKKEKGVFEK